MVLSSAMLCLAMAIYYEARSETSLGQIAVGEVILERTKSRFFPNTICGVVKENRSKKPGFCQFSFYCDGKPENMPNKKARKQAFQIAHRLLDLDRPYFDDGSVFYHATYVRPYWSKKMAFTKQVGKHIFYDFPYYKSTKSRKNIVINTSIIPKSRPKQ